MNGEGRDEEEGERKGEGGKEWRRERVGRERVGERKSRGGEGGEGLCSSKNSFKKPPCSCRIT